jgi:hypothetical protein
MPLDIRQQHELWLTAAQSLFAIVLIADGTMRHWEAFALLVPFVIQLVLPPTIGPVDVRLAFTFAYLAAALLLLSEPRRRHALLALPTTLRHMLFSRAPNITD